MEESLQFYRDVMGLKIKQEYQVGPEGYAKVLEDKDGTLVELMYAPNRNPGFAALRVNTSDCKRQQMILKQRVIKSFYTQ